MLCVSHGLHIDMADKVGAVTVTTFVQVLETIRKSSCPSFEFELLSEVAELCSAAEKRGSLGQLEQNQNLEGP